MDCCKFCGAEMNLNIVILKDIDIMDVLFRRDIVPYRDLFRGVGGWVVVTFREPL
jgi:hypothetical protein